jgi:hypothetical protein
VQAGTCSTHHDNNERGCHTFTACQLRHLIGNKLQRALAKPVAPREPIGLIRCLSTFDSKRDQLGKAGMDAEQKQKWEENVEKMLNENPLVVFSIYTNGQWKVVRELSRKIIECLDTGIVRDEKANSTSVNKFSEVYDQFWLWAPGAYEIVRTMYQAKQCFSDRLVLDLTKLESELRLIRVPLAKQEVPLKRGECGNKKSPVTYEASVHSIEHSPPDFHFKVQGK